MGSSAITANYVGDPASVNTGSSAASANNARHPNFASMQSGATSALPVGELASASTGNVATNADNVGAPAFAFIASNATNAQSAKTYHAHLKAARSSAIGSANPQSC